MLFFVFFPEFISGSLIQEKQKNQRNQLYQLSTFYFNERTDQPANQPISNSYIHSFIHSMIQSTLGMLLLFIQTT